MNAATSSLIQMRDIKKVFFTDEVETHALAGVHFDLARGEYVSISGPSGCGKSTLLSILGLLDTPTNGTYTLNEQAVVNLDFAQRARKAEAVQKAEQEGHHPGQSLGQAALALPGFDDFDCQEDNGQRNRSLDRGLRKPEESQCRAHKRDRMRHGESRRGLDDRPAALEQQDQCEHEEEMIISSKDMFHPDHEIGARHLPAVRNGTDRIAAPVRRQLLGLNRPAQRRHAQQRIGRARLHAAKPDGRPLQRSGAGHRAGRHHSRAGNARRLQRQLAKAGQQGLCPDGKAAKNGCLPDQLPVGSGLLGQFQISRAQFIGPCGRAQHEHEGAHGKKDNRPHLGRSITTS